MQQMNTIKNSRTLSIIVLFFIYAVAAILAVAVYSALNYSFIVKLLAADICATVFVFGFSLIFANASVYDPYWSVQPIVILAAFALNYKLTAAGILLIIAVSLWGLRLTANWAYTFHGLACQDWRYTDLRNKTGVLYPFVNFFGIHLIPTLIVYACILPAVFVIRNGAELNAGLVVGFIISVCAFTVQGIADIQMHRFRLHKQNGETSESFIRTGLWKYSRHPNYLGEILMWWGVAIASVSVLPQYPLLLVGAVANTALFLLVSIPLADGHQSRKEGFDTYRSQTRILLPLKRF